VSGRRSIGITLWARVLSLALSTLLLSLALSVLSIVPNVGVVCHCWGWGCPLGWLTLMLPVISCPLMAISTHTVHPVSNGSRGWTWVPGGSLSSPPVSRGSQWCAGVTISVVCRHVLSLYQKYTKNLKKERKD
jgi:hypothetical protein